MRLLETFVESPWAGTAGWALLHSLWPGAIVSAVLAVVLLATRSPRIRYAAACLAMLTMLVAFGVTLFQLAPAGLPGPRVLRPLPFFIWNVAPLTNASESWDRSLAAIVTSLAPWLAPFWIAGVLVFYLRSTLGFLSLRQLRRRGVCSTQADWERRLAGLSVRLHVSRPVLLLESCLADSPMVIGHFRPLILMPIGLLTGLPAAQIEAIFLHELAHIRRHDYPVNALQNLVAGLLFYHPAIWWISGVIRAEREHCCDDLAVGVNDNAHEYAAALAALEQNRWSGREPAVAARGGSLMKRIRRLLYPARPSGAWTPVLAFVILFSAAMIAFGAWHPDPQSSTGTAPPVATPLVEPWEKWLNQDVVYIINDRERVAFLKLTTDDERQMFVEQFWLRRDPSPGTLKNEYKEEHYRRIAWANQHFTESVPGWKTDRGHMYILYGPPDEIDSHPSATPHPYEMWAYRHSEGIGEKGVLTFTADAGSSDFHLVKTQRHVKP